MDCFSYCVRLVHFAQKNTKPITFKFVMVSRNMQFNNNRKQCMFCLKETKLKYF